MKNKIFKISNQILVSSKIFKKSLKENDLYNMYKSIQSMKSLHGKLLVLYNDHLNKNKK